MIYDAFTFYNELDVLEMRLRLLDDVVDTFVLCEAPFTFRGAAKPLFFAEHAERFARWRDRIIALVYPGPSDPDPWRNEWGQRDYSARGFAGCGPDDLILIGDCDEIPDPENVALRPAPGKILAHVQTFSKGYFNRVMPGFEWFGTRAFAARDFLRFGTVTGVRGYPPAELETVKGGWHFHSLGGPDVMEAGIRAKSHSEFDVTYFRDPVRLAEAFAGEHDGGWIPFDTSFPAPLHEQRWSPFVWERPVHGSAAGAPARAHAHGCFGYVPSDAAAVYAVTDDVETWESAGRSRYGARFAGAASSLQTIVASVSPDAWVVIDGLERQDPRALAELQGRGAGVVAYAGNAGSRDVLEAVIAGAPFPPGRAVGAVELPQWIRSLGWEIGLVERIPVSGVFAILAQLPEQLSVENGRFRFSNITRDTLSDFLAKAFIFTLPPRSA